ncbi:uncharacterized protein LOC102801376, partial [Saccoglossus kowalevskii]|uniref:Cleft lip and palate transmembrane protein 1 homolog n=1 Tax=Saccoglossus kowalevskii TaxID=10224 RepID=A0ABM0MR91_SACKO
MADTERTVESEDRNNGDVAVQGENGQVEQQEQPQQQQQQQQNGWQMVKGFMFRLLIIYMISSFFRGRSNTPETPTAGPDGTPITLGRNLFPKETMMDLRIYISENEFFTQFNESKYLLWEENNLEYGDWISGPNGDGSYSYSGQIEATENMMNNGSIYLHVYLTKVGKSPDPSDKKRYSKKATAYKTKSTGYRANQALTLNNMQLWTQLVNQAVLSERLLFRVGPLNTLSVLSSPTAGTSCDPGCGGGSEGDGEGVSTRPFKFWPPECSATNHDPQPDGPAFGCADSRYVQHPAGPYCPLGRSGFGQAGGSTESVRLSYS